MSTNWVNEWEGPADGTTLTVGTAGNASSTTGNETGSTNYVSTISLGGGTAVFSTGQVDNGLKTLKITNASGAVCLVGVPVNATTSGTVTGDLATAMAVDIYIMSTPITSGCQIIQGRTAAGAAWNVVHNTNGSFSLTNSSGAIVVSSSAITGLPRWLHFEVDALSDASAGTLALRIYAMTGTAGSLTVSTLLYDSTTQTGVNTRGGAQTEIRIGKLAANTNVDPLWYGSMKIKSGSTVPSTPGAGPYLNANTAPVVTAGATQNLAATATTTTLTANVTDDTAATSATWALRTSSASSNPTVGSTSASPALPSASTTITASVTGLLPGRHIFDLTVGDGSLTTVGTTVVNITSPTPAYLSVTAASYTVVGGGTALQAIQAATPGSRYLQSAAPPAGGTGSIAYQPLQAASVPTVFGVKARASDAVTSVAITVYLKMNGTTVATRGPFALTTTDATYGGTTTSPEDATITDKSQLTTDWSVT